VRFLLHLLFWDITVSPKNKSRGTVFISYSHEDENWVKRVRVHLRPLKRYCSIHVWDDTKLKPGTNWREDIQNAIASAKVAILIVSANFLASNFIAKKELPPLLEAAEERGTIILMLFVSPSMYAETVLERYQGVNDPKKPLNDLTVPKREKIYYKLAKTVLNLLPSILKSEQKEEIRKEIVETLETIGKFEIKHESYGKFSFNLKATNGKIILKSNKYKTKSGLKNAIKSVKHFAPDTTSFQRETSINKSFFFYLKAINGKKIGSSNVYSSKRAMENAISLIQVIAPKAQIVDLTKTK
jgi:uncharacterized protein YegP (UPF0339 family)